VAGKRSGKHGCNARDGGQDFGFERAHTEELNKRRKSRARKDEKVNKRTTTTQRTESAANGEKGELLSQFLRIRQKGGTPEV
jgi:hypothetical protein